MSRVVGLTSQTIVKLKYAEIKFTEDSYVEVFIRFCILFKLKHLDLVANGLNCKQSFHVE